MAQSIAPEQLARRWERLTKLNYPDLMKVVLGAGIELVIAERKQCASVVANQSDPNAELPRIHAIYGEEEAWRYVAHPALERLFDSLVELERRACLDDETATPQIQLSMNFGRETDAL